MRNERAGGAGATCFSLQVGTDQVWQELGNGRAWGLTSLFISIQLLTGYIEENLDLKKRGMKHLNHPQIKVRSFGGF